VCSTTSVARFILLITCLCRLQAPLLALFTKHKDSKGKQAKLKSPGQLQELLDIVRQLLGDMEAKSAAAAAAAKAGVVVSEEEQREQELVSCGQVQQLVSFCLFCVRPCLWLIKW
jgi:hypothetical protein